MKGVDAVIGASTSVCYAQVKQTLTNRDMGMTRARAHRVKRVSVTHKISEAETSTTEDDDSDHQPTRHIDDVSALCFSDGLRKVDVVFALTFALAATLAVACAPFDTSNATDGRLLFVAHATVPLGAIALYDLSTRRGAETARFGMLYGLVLAVAASAIAGLTFGPALFGGGSLTWHAGASGLQATVLVMFGLYVSYRSYVLRRRCVPRAETPADTADISAAVAEHFGRALGWAQALFLSIVAADIAVRGGPCARPGLTSAIALATVLPVGQALLMSAAPCTRASRLGHVAYVAAAVASAAAQVVWGLVLPMIRAASIVRGHVIELTTDASASPHPGWTRQLCGDAPETDCVALAVRTYVAICASIGICLYSAYFSRKICAMSSSCPRKAHCATTPRQDD